jgi:hypothetical protein
LVLGDQRENMRQRSARGRAPTGEKSGAYRHPESRPRGEAHGGAKITTEQVREIRRLAAEGYNSAKLAPIYGLSKAGIQFIVRRRTWKHV